MLEWTEKDTLYMVMYTAIAYFKIKDGKTTIILNNGSELSCPKSEQELRAVLSGHAQI